LNSQAANWGLLYGVATILISFVTTVNVLYLQVWALVRHRHRSFWLLIISTAFTVFYLVAAAAIFVFYANRMYPPGWYYCAAFVPFILSNVIGVRGTASLLRSYRALADRVSSLPPE
jgi:predicted membrane-bound dolichyl-phosphate-mannose-protein mannosyltransferase